MKKSVFFFVAVLLLILLAPTALAAQEQTKSQKITVKSKEVSNGVVILAVQEGKKSIELQCNKNMAGCTVLEPGDYGMVRLPKNHGIYDCVNAEVYQKSANSEAGRERLGQYCLMEAK